MTFLQRQRRMPTAHSGLISLELLVPCATTLDWLRLRGPLIVPLGCWHASDVGTAAPSAISRNSLRNGQPPRRALRLTRAMRPPVESEFLNPRGGRGFRGSRKGCLPLLKFDKTGIGVGLQRATQGTRNTTPFYSTERSQ